MLPGVHSSRRLAVLSFALSNLAEIMQDKVSVIIPCYNHAGGLSAAIHSVRDQSWPNVEIIVVDDGSTDQTQSLLRELNGSDLQILQQQNQGPAAARNAAPSRSRNTPPGHR